MRDKITLTDNKTKGEEVWVGCEKCLIQTRHIVMQSLELEGTAWDWDYHYSEKYQIVKCQGCDSISFRKSHMNSEDYYGGPPDEEPEPQEYIYIFPSLAFGRKKLEDLYYLPYQVKLIYEETHSAVCNKQPILSCIGMRALVEAVCKEKAASGRGLKVKIDNLVTTGALTPSGAIILHELRGLGNGAAHEVAAPTEKVISIAMDVIEHLLMDVYVLPKIASKLTSYS